jgi:aminomethyltransferase
MVGHVTSSTWSPYQVCGVAIVHLRGTDLQAGAIVEVDCVDGDIHQAELCTLPMYDPKGEIVRGINTVVPKGPEPWICISKDRTSKTA